MISARSVSPTPYCLSGKLDPDEWEIMKTHAALGAEAIWHAIQGEQDTAGLEFLFVVMDIAHYHYERWDGTGYPDCLAGDAIPLPTRVMALADVYDALICPRVYQAAMSRETAAKMIVDGRGSHFDPDLVDAFLSCQDEFQAIADRYRDEYAQVEILDIH